MATKKTAAASKKPMTKSELIQALADASDGVSKAQVKSIIEQLSEIAHKELKKNRVFKLPGFAKFTVVRKKATAERTVVSGLTGQPTTYKAKPAHNAVRARPEKAIKDAVN